MRRDYAKASTAKIKAFLARAGSDGRVRGAFLFRAAGTGRYSSTGAQVHNLPRPRKVFDDEHLDARDLFEAIRQANVEWLEILYGDELGKPLPLVSDSIRGFIWAGPGKELLAADYSGIEGAIQAWFAGEDWKVKALFDLIADPSLPDMYRRAAAGIYNTTTDLLTKKDKRRQVGKVSELSLGYQGGVGAFRSMARNYSMKLGPIFGPAWEAADPERREKVDKRYEECCERNELLTRQLTREEWMGAELVKVGWRATHPAIVASWKTLEAAAREAVENPGRQVPALKVSFIVARGFLWCKLPSGRCLAYGAPSIREVEVPWADKALTPDLREKRPVVTCLGVDSQTRRLVRYALYGGLVFENVVQAIALDLLDHGIELAEGAGYPVVGHVHDEIIAEVPYGWGDLAAFERLICQLPEWARGLPLTAGGWRGKRYRKD
jgi:DNA polymerase